MPVLNASAPAVKKILSVILPAILIAFLSIYALGFKAKTTDQPKVLLGSPLASLEDIYPIRPNETGALYLDKERFEKAIDYLSANPSPRAISDLLYLGKMNNVTLMLSEQTKSKYIAMTEQPEYAAIVEAEQQKDRLLQTYADIVNGIGQTFSGTPIEIVLHDTRNPMKSIVAVQNPISGRRLGDPNTNFGVQLIKNYSTGTSNHGTSFVSYGLTLKDGRKIKSSTIPLFNETYGLIGFICLNIDISKMDGKDPAAIARFVDAFRTITENEAITEMIQNSKRKS